MDEELKSRIKTFFHYWRKRHEFIRDLDFDKNNHEANVLLWAALDALSNLWAKNIGKEECKGKGNRLIFDTFLAKYGGEIFQLVSLPSLWHRAEQEVKRNEKKLPEQVYQLLSTIGERQIPTFLNERQLRHSSDDWELDEIVTATLKNFPETNPMQLQNWLSLSRYGAIAYKEMRNSYIHEGQPGKGTHGFKLSQSAIRPTYLSGIYTTPPMMGFAVEFMSTVLEDCIDAFEADALKLQIDPVPNE